MYGIGRAEATRFERVTRSFERSASASSAAAAAAAVKHKRAHSPDPQARGPLAKRLLLFNTTRTKVGAAVHAHLSGSADSRNGVFAVLNTCILHLFTNSQTANFRPRGSGGASDLRITPLFTMGVVWVCFLPKSYTFASRVARRMGISSSFHLHFAVRPLDSC